MNEQFMCRKFQHLLCQRKCWYYFYEMLYIFICFISSAPYETTDCLDFWNPAPILSSWALLPGLQLHNQFLLKCVSLKCRSMERDIKDFIIFSQNSVRIKGSPSPSHTTICTPFYQLTLNIINTAAVLDNHIKVAIKE